MWSPRALPCCSLLLFLGLGLACGASKEPASLQDTAEQAADYALLHTQALAFDDAPWSASLERLAKEGDAFSLEQLSTLSTDLLDRQQRELLASARSAIAERLSTADEPLPVDAIQPLLERAAWVDLQCHPMEHTLVPWAEQTIAAHRGEEPVRRELKRLAETYQAQGPDQLGFGSLTDRVRVYARAWREGP